MAYHVRRRLTDAEAVQVGGVCDLRGSAEGWKRFERIKPLVPEIVHRMAIEELQQVPTSGQQEK